MRKWFAQTLADIKLGLWLGEACRSADWMAPKSIMRHGTRGRGRLYGKQ